MDGLLHRRAPARARPRSIAQRTQSEALVLLALNLRTGIGAGVVGTLGALVWLWPSMSSPVLLLWAGAIFAGLLASAYLVRTSAQWAHAPDRLEWCLAANMFYIGALWGVLPLLGGYDAGGSAQTLIIMLLGIVALGGAGILAPRRLAFFAFIVPEIAPILFILAIEPPPAMPHAALAAGIFAVMLGALHELFHHTLNATLQQRLTSDTLAAEQSVILDSTAEAIVLTRGERLVKCNQRFAELVGEPIDTLRGRPLWQWLADPGEWHHNAQRAVRAMAAGLTFRTKVQVRRANGELRWIEFSADPVDPKRLDKGIVWLGQDLSSRLRSEATLHASEERYRRLITLTSDWYWEWDAKLRFTHLNGPGLARAGLSPSMYGQTLATLTHIAGVSIDGWAGLQRQIERREPFRDFIWQLNPEGENARWFSMSGNPTFDTEGNFAGYHGIGSEVTEQMRGSEQFRQLAYHDTLTGLPNRRLLDDRLHLAIAQSSRRGQQLAVMLVDLDRFKTINDTAGHAIGDLVLVAIARRLQSATRASDTVARLGGDEFVVILPDIETESAARRVADKMVESLVAPVEADGKHYRLGGSIGVAIYPDDGNTARTLLARADAAMYEAKRQGGSRHVSHRATPVTTA
ncbi:MAG: diguanylate cyclase [Rhodocyclaceae bacterium]|nr:diguanylate cyclase [Rhodocyclaceae bacterium]